METLAEKLELIDCHVARAMEAVERDPNASPVLRAVVEEFQKKSRKSRGTLTSGGDDREAVVELEQAADSARVAAFADPGAADTTRKLVDIAHAAICLLKAGA